MDYAEIQFILAEAALKGLDIGRTVCSKKLL